ncbi:MAG: antibiotic biosynthesis monooxygenase [Thermoleophilia bacterium]|nr:antibiotic biosynthesis monooxygenase [Thermoleophilia bacterium]
MPEVLVVAVVKPKEGKEKDVEELFSSLVAPTHAEDGCLTYALHRDTRTPGQLVFVERWEHGEAAGTH